MKAIIKEVDYQNNIFYIVRGNQKIGFHLTTRLAQTFMGYLEVGYLVDFKILDKEKTFNKRKTYQVNHFNLIRNLYSNRDLYNLAHLRNAMMEFLNNHNYYLFIDMEMTMARFREKNFVAEILQYGYVLIDKEHQSILENSNYLEVLSKHLNKRIFRFLKIDEQTYQAEAINPLIFYNELKAIINKYQPKIVVWGGNDIKALNDFYKIHNLTPLTTNNDFIDLLKLHRNFFNLRNDLGLFKAYQQYYQVDYDQQHDAIEDAKITKEVFKAFKLYGELQK